MATNILLPPAELLQRASLRHVSFLRLYKAMFYMKLYSCKNSSITLTCHKIFEAHSIKSLAPLHEETWNVLNKTGLNPSFQHFNVVSQTASFNQFQHEAGYNTFKEEKKTE
ncbi:UNVERIFIED_CONTAM: hypothetical protein K2H54_004694 [Gekko kuhli]